MQKCMWLIAVAAVVGLITSASSVVAQPPGGGGRPSFQKLLDAFDDNNDGELTEDEVPARVWMRLKNADKDGNGSLTKTEFDNTVGGGRGR